MNGEHHGVDLLPIVILLAAGVIAAPLFKRMGLGSVLGYLAGGIIIGPNCLGLLTHPETILEFAELGVVLFLFLVGLEIRPAQLWGMRREIFGLGLVQVAGCALLLTTAGVACGLPIATAFVAGAGFVLTSTAIVMQVLEERGELRSKPGQRIVSVLLLEDLLIVPLLAVVAILARVDGGQAETGGGIDFVGIGIGLGSLIVLVLAGLYLLNPLFTLLANAKAREFMTAAALLVVLGAAYLMDLVGFSMAMGAFAAGVLLSGSSYRHQLEVDIEPFRGVLLGVFFLAVGMSLDLDVVASSWRLVLLFVVAFMLIKAASIYGIARLFKSGHAESLQRATIMAQGGEFAFVLYGAALSAGILNVNENAIFTAVVVLSMTITPLVVTVTRLLSRNAGQSTDGYARPDGLSATALVIGFGRVGQIASQFLMSRKLAISIIDTDTEMIDAARELDFDVYYGDGTRLDILNAAGAPRARVALVCVDRPEDATRITELFKAEFPKVPVLVRAHDRRHSIELIRTKADMQVRETFESAMVLGAGALERLGIGRADIAAIARGVRERDALRLEKDIREGVKAGGQTFFRGPSLPDQDQSQT